MTPAQGPTVVIVPGLRDHVDNHWQTLLAQRLTAAGHSVLTVPPLTRNHLNCDARVVALKEVVEQAAGPVLIVAHSAGVLTTVHWAQWHRARVKGALLATPPDFETPLPEGYPSTEVLYNSGWTPVPRTRLPFPSIVAASSNDPLATEEWVAGLARDWGSRLVQLGDVAHLNPASGYGDWPQAETYLRVLGLV